MYDKKNPGAVKKLYFIYLSFSFIVVTRKKKYTLSNMIKKIAYLQTKDAIKEFENLSQT
jgi:hypothetical protein